MSEGERLTTWLHEKARSADAQSKGDEILEDQGLLQASLYHPGSVVSVDRD